jgi:hypothetical protein
VVEGDGWLSREPEYLKLRGEEVYNDVVRLTFKGESEGRELN